MALPSKLAERFPDFAVSFSPGTYIDRISLRFPTPLSPDTARSVLVEVLRLESDWVVDTVLWSYGIPIVVTGMGFVRGVVNE